MSLIQEISALEVQEQTISANVPLDVVQLKNIQSQLAAKRAELEQQQSAEELQQKETEHSDKLLDIANQIYEALFPKNTYASILGLNTYEEKQQSFNQLYHAAINEHTQPLIESYKGEIAKRDEKIKTLNQQALDAENQLSDIRKQLDETTRDRDDHSAARKLAEDELAGMKAARAQKDAEAEKMAVQILSLTNEVEQNKAALNDNAQLKQQIADLEAKLEEATMPATKPSMAFSELLKNTQIKSSKDLALDGTIFRGKIELPSIPPLETHKEGQFQGTDQTEDRTTQLANLEAPPLPEIGQVTEDQFPSSGENVAGEDMVLHDAGSETIPSDDAPVPRSEFESLVNRVCVIEQHFMQKGQVAS